MAVRENIIKVFGKMGNGRPMPKFAMYSRLDKNLLKLMLIRATEIEDDEIAGLRAKYFHPE